MFELGRLLLVLFVESTLQAAPIEPEGFSSGVGSALTFCFPPGDHRE